MILLTIKTKNYKIIFTSWEIFRLYKDPKEEWIPLLNIIKYSIIAATVSLVIIALTFKQ